MGHALPDLRYFRFTETEVAGVRCTLSRTGYTGEWGYELYLAAEAAEPLWRRLTGHSEIRPAGLGARDTLRLEVGYPLYGHELSASMTPAPSTGARFLDLAKDFIGRDAVQRDLDEGAARRLCGLRLESRRAAREGDVVLAHAKDVGLVTSGSLAPSLEVAVAMAYLDAGVSAAGTAVEVDVRGRCLPATVVDLPFYREGTARGGKAKR